MSNANPTRVRIISDDKVVKPNKQAKRALPPAPGTPEYRALLRRAIKNATAAFASQDAFQPEEPIPEQDAAVVAALTKLANRPNADPNFIAVMRELTEAITGRKYEIGGRVVAVRYNYLAAFVPLASESGHNYPLNKPAIVIGSSGNGDSSLIPSSQQGGNTPPPKVRRIDGEKTVEVVRPATDAEIDTLTEDNLMFIERNIKTTLVPVEV